jgi:hypothetical protein
MPEHGKEYQPQGYEALETLFEEHKGNFLTLARRGKMPEEEIAQHLQALNDALGKEKIRLMHGEALDEKAVQNIFRFLREARETAVQHDALDKEDIAKVREKSSK